MRAAYQLPILNAQNMAVFVPGGAFNQDLNQAVRAAGFGRSQYLLKGETVFVMIQGAVTNLNITLHQIICGLVVHHNQTKNKIPS